jgi:uncharacterized protein
MITIAFAKFILDQFPMKPQGIHGIFHWARVFENGLRLAGETGARLDVIEHFALLHDSRRLNDWGDHDHGPRAATFIASLREQWIDLDEEGYDWLVQAVKGHTNGSCDADVTVQTCWDADRLDLKRVGISPLPSRLCTLPAREPSTIQSASERAWYNWIAEATLEAWGFDWRELAGKG